MGTPISPTELRSTLDAIGDTAAIASELLAGLDEATLRRPTMSRPSCYALVQELVEAGAELGRVAHDVLGHVPGVGSAPYAAHDTSDIAALLTQLRFLRAHIVSTVDQQGAEVWATPTPAGRPLIAYAVDL